MRSALCANHEIHPDSCANRKMRSALRANRKIRSVFYVNLEIRSAVVQINSAIRAQRLRIANGNPIFVLQSHFATSHAFLLLHIEIQRPL